MAKNGVLRGKKFNGNHSTFIAEAELVIVTAKTMTQVKKVVLGVIAPKNSSQPRLKVTPVQGGLRILVRGKNAIQELFIYGDDLDAVIKKLTTKWDEANHDRS